MYLTAFGRAASDADVARVSAQLAAGLTKGELITLFTQSNELKTARAGAYDPSLDQVRAVTQADVYGDDHDEDQVTSYAYDKAGRLIEVAGATGIRSRMVLDAMGQVVDTIVAYGTADAATTRRTYDLSGRVLTETRAHGTSEYATVTYTYDAAGNVLKIRDARGNDTYKEYDARGLVLKVSVQLEGTLYAVTYNEYDQFGNLVKVTDPRGNASYSYYDKLNRLSLHVDAEGYATETAYSLGGQAALVTRYQSRVPGTLSPATRPTPATGPLDATTVMRRDKLDRLVGIVDAEGYSESYALNAYGDRVSVTNKLGGVIANAYDRRGLLLSETLPISSYHAEGSLRAGSVTNRFEYDSRGNRTKKIEAAGLPEQRVTGYVFDRIDRVVEIRNPSVAVLDPANHVTVTTVTPVESFKYDGRGNVIEAVDALGARTLSYYNKAGQKIVEINALGTYTSFTYDKNGNMLTRRMYGGTVALPAAAGGTPPSPPTQPVGDTRETVQTFDKANRLKSSRVGGIRAGAWNGSSYYTTGAPTVSYNYDSAGNLIKETDGRNGVVYSYYNKVGSKVAQLDQENYLTTWARDAEGNALGELRYATRFVGTASTAAPPAVASHMDDRLTVFTYDRNGRRLTESRMGVAAHVVNWDGTLSAATGNATITYEYNGLGQVTRKSEATGNSVNYGYDAAGRLTSEERTGYFDHTGNFVRPTLHYAYNGLNDVAFTKQGGNSYGAERISRYYYGTSGRLTHASDPTGGMRAYFYDAAGNLLRESYDRYNGSGGYVTEGALYKRDLLGRITWQTVGTLVASSWWSPGDTQNVAYNSYGDVSQRGVNGLWQEQFAYDQSGRVWRTNSGDGVWRYFLYDGNGNRTLAIESEGNDIAGKTQDEMLAIVANGGTLNGATSIGTHYIDGINVTLDVFDKRNQVVETRRPQRQLSAAAAPVDLISYRGYNAFGEMAFERDARGGQTNYLYNTMGRNVSIQRPTVSVTSENGYRWDSTPINSMLYDISGRLIGVYDANGGRTSRTLLTGTGYGGTEALTTRENHDDGGSKRKSYDAFGDVRRSWDELDRVTDMSYDGMGRLRNAVRPSGVSDWYTYDILGQRTSSWNSLLGTATTDYDTQGRVVRETPFSGDVVQMSYVWTASIGSALGTTGGWIQTTTYANTMSASEKVDLYGHQIQKADLSGRTSDFTYDLAGRMISRSGGDPVNYTYLNTGLLASTWKGFGDPDWGGDFERTETVYGYDEGGNRTSELYRLRGQRWEEPIGPYTPYDPATDPATDPNGDLQLYVLPPEEEGHYVTYGEVYQNITAYYDKLSRMTSWSAASTSRMPAAGAQYEYDANGNVRRITAQYSKVASNGSITAGEVQDNWYRYDSLNRVIVSEGVMSPYGTIVAGTGGVTVSYDAAGQRRLAVRTESKLVGFFYENFVQREEYGYDAGGHLKTIHIDEQAPSGSWSARLLRASYVYDGMGRLTSQKDYLTNGTVGFERSVKYNYKGQAYEDTSITKRDGDTYKNVTTNDFGSGSNYALGAVVTSTTSNYKNTSLQEKSSTANTYQWWDGAVLSAISHDRDTGNPLNAVWKTTYHLNASGQIGSVRIEDGRPRSVSFLNDMNGQAIRRDEADSKSGGDPHEYWYRLGGRQLGYTGNNGTIETGYLKSITRRTGTTGTGAFRGGDDDGTVHADFDQNYDPINSFIQGSGGGSHTVGQGESLSSIAVALWGDASLWYKIAEINGMSGGTALVEGQQLILPTGVLKSANNATTFKPYDPAETIGETSPTTAKPPRQARCGFFGQVLLVVIAVAVSAITYGALAPAMGGTVFGLIGAGAISGAAGSVASQGFGVATGIQVTPFSLRDVGIAAIGGGVGAGLGEFKALAKIGNSALREGTRGVLSSGVTQLVAMGLSLQPKFNWSGVAAAAVGGAVSGGLDGQIGRYQGQLIGGSAGVLAGAAAKSLQDGSSFGDNVRAGLPGVIGSTVGNMISDRYFPINRQGTGTGSGAEEGSGTGQSRPGLGVGAAEGAPLPRPTAEQLDDAIAKVLAVPLPERPAPPPPDVDAEFGQASTSLAYRGEDGREYYVSKDGTKYPVGTMKLLTGLAIAARDRRAGSIANFDALVDQQGSWVTASQLGREVAAGGQFAGLEPQALTLLAEAISLNSRNGLAVYQDYIPQTQFGGNPEIYLKPWMFLPTWIPPQTINTDLSNGQRVAAGAWGVFHGGVAIVSGIGALGTAETGIGAFLLGAAAVTEADNSIAQFRTAISGVRTHTIGAHSISRVFNVGLDRAEGTYSLIQLGLGGASIAHSGFKLLARPSLVAGARGAATTNARFEAAARSLGVRGADDLLTTNAARLELRAAEVTRKRVVAARLTDSARLDAVAERMATRVAGRARATVQLQDAQAAAAARNSAVAAADAAASQVDEVIQLGGAHRDVKGIAGHEAHHMPANSVSPLSTGKGPAIAMPIPEHRMTASWGSSREAKAYRKAQEALIAQGDFRAAQQMDIADISVKFGNKYDDAIQQMLRYTTKIGY